MKKQETTGRILGRRMAREMSHQELAEANDGSLQAAKIHTLTFPPDKDLPSGPI